jgi:hypothetical protein
MNGTGSRRDHRRVAEVGLVGEVPRIDDVEAAAA